MNNLRLATLSGAQIAPANPLRYVSSGGEVIDQAQPSVRITLAEAREMARLFDEAHREVPHPRMAALYGMWAAQVSEAVARAVEWGRAA
jgi:hypothetical protein